MAMRFEDLLEETATYSGGQLILSGALPGRRPFSAALTSGDTIFARASGIDTPEEWILAVMTWTTSPDRLTVGQIMASSTGGAAVVFSGAVQVACVQPAAGVVAIGKAGAAPSASGPSSVAIGPGAMAGGYSSSLAVGAGAVAGDGSMAVGPNANALAWDSVAIGVGAKAWEDRIIAIGPAEFIWSDRDTGTLGPTEYPVALALPPLSAVLADVHVIGVRSDGAAAWSGRASFCAHRAASGPVIFADGAPPPIATVSATAGVTAGASFTEMYANDGLITVNLLGGAAGELWCWSVSVTGTWRSAQP